MITVLTLTGDTVGFTGIKLAKYRVPDLFLYPTMISSSAILKLHLFVVDSNIMSECLSWADNTKKIFQLADGTNQTSYG